MINICNRLTPVRHDRDDFIHVNEENIEPNLVGNFEKRPYGDAGFHTDGSVDSEHTPYDVLSVIVCEKRFSFFLILFWALASVWCNNIFQKEASRFSNRDATQFIDNNGV